MAALQSFPSRLALGLAVVITVGVVRLSGQSPIIAKTALPSPPCGVLQAVADFDLTGRPDFLIVSSNGSLPYLAVVSDPASPGSGACQLTPISGLTTTSNPTLRVANLDGNGIPDVLVSSSQENKIFVAYGNGTGGFTFPGIGPYPSTTTNGVAVMAIGDFDGDGRDDAVVRRATGPYGVLEVFRNQASGWSMSWTHAHATQTGSTPVEAADFDGDGLLDILWTQYASNIALTGTLNVARGLGNGTFAVAQPIPVGAPSSIAAVADLDSDGLADVALNLGIFFSSQSIRVVFGVPSGSVAGVTQISTPFSQFAVATPVDFDGDGIRDLVVEGALSPFLHPVVLLRGLGARQFTTAATLSNETLNVPEFVKLFAADMDGDGDADLLRSRASSGTPLDLFSNLSIYTPGCAGTGGAPPVMSMGIPTLGNASFAIRVSGAAPNQPAALGISYLALPVSGCGVAIDPDTLIMPALITWTDATGAASIPLPVPPNPGFGGLVVCAQWAVLDPQGSALVIGYPASLSSARAILIW